MFPPTRTPNPRFGEPTPRGPHAGTTPATPPRTSVRAPPAQPPKTAVSISCVTVLGGTVVRPVGDSSQWMTRSTGSSAARDYTAPTLVSATSSREDHQSERLAFSWGVVSLVRSQDTERSENDVFCIWLISPLMYLLLIILIYPKYVAMLFVIPAIMATIIGMRWSRILCR
ncbi:hypothetical protein Trydic_g14599 [Trypoxylus dichotomus]